MPFFLLLRVPAAIFRRRGYAPLYVDACFSCHAAARHYARAAAFCSRFSPMMIRFARSPMLDDTIAACRLIRHCFDVFDDDLFHALKQRVASSYAARLISMLDAAATMRQHTPIWRYDCCISSRDMIASSLLALPRAAPCSIRDEQALRAFYAAFDMSATPAPARARGAAPTTPISDQPSVSAHHHFIHCHAAAFACRHLPESRCPQNFSLPSYHRFAALLRCWRQRLHAFALRFRRHYASSTLIAATRVIDADRLMMIHDDFDNYYVALAIFYRLSSFRFFTSRLLRFASDRYIFTCCHFHVSSLYCCFFFFIFFVTFSSFMRRTFLITLYFICFFLLVIDAHRCFYEALSPLILHLIIFEMMFISRRAFITISSYFLDNSSFVYRLMIRRRRYFIYFRDVEAIFSLSPVDFA